MLMILLKSSVESARVALQVGVCRIHLTLAQSLPGSSPKLQLNEVLVQGSQVKAVTEVLLAKGIPKRWIKEGDDSKKKK